MKKVETEKKTTVKQKEPVARPEQVSLLQEAAGIGSLYRTAGISLRISDVAVLLKLNDLYATKGLDASIMDVQKIVSSVLQDPAFKEQKQQQ